MSGMELFVWFGFVPILVPRVLSGDGGAFDVVRERFEPQSESRWPGPR
jgi:hypothetical protein